MSESGRPSSSTTDGLFDYVHQHGVRKRGGKGPTGHWRLPPNVSAIKVALSVGFWCSLAAIPVFVLPMLKSEEERAKKPAPNMYSIIKEKNKEERMRWIQSVEMPPR